MSIAIPTYAPGSIASYSDLLVEVRDMMDDANYDAAAIARACRKAEAEFNRSIRALEMEKRSVLSVTGELTPLPDDFLELRALFQEGTPDRVMASMSPAGMTAAFAGTAGTPQAYSIEGLQLRVAPVGIAAIELAYYAAIPPLSDAQVSNWLLRRHPDLYIAGILYYLRSRETDREGKAEAWQELVVLMASINRSTQTARWGAAPLTPTGIQQVWGARA